MITQNHGLPQLPPMSGLDALAQGSQYALQQLHESNNRQPPNGHSQNHHDSYNKDGTQGRVGQDQSAGQQGIKTGNGPARRRISRACDQCNQLRTKCDGQTPCAHCVGMRVLEWCIIMITWYLISRRIRSYMRIQSPAQKTRQSISKRSCTTASSRYSIIRKRSE